MNYGEKAGEYFKSGYNCAQAVLLAFSDKTGLDEKTAAEISAGFGAGIGRLRETCGAVSGAVMALGLICKAPQSREEKAALNEKAQKAAFALEKRFGSYKCSAILGEPDGPADPMPDKRTPDYFQTRPCLKCVVFAAESLEGILKDCEAI